MTRFLPAGRPQLVVALPDLRGHGVGVDEVVPGAAGRLDVARGPQRRVGLLPRLEGQLELQEVVVLGPFAGDDPRLPGTHQHGLDLTGACGRLVRLMAELQVLERRDPLADAQLKAPVGEHVDHDQVLEQPDRVVQREADNRRDELQPRGLPRHSGQEYRCGRRRGQWVTVVLGEVKGVEAPLLGALERGDPLLVNLLDGLVGLGLDVIEDPELDAHGTPSSAVSRRCGRRRARCPACPGTGCRRDRPRP